MSELEGQMNLFTLEGCEPGVQKEHEDEMCECRYLQDLSLSELIVAYGNACADLNWQLESGHGRAVDNAEQYHHDVVDELRRRGYKVAFNDPA